MLYFYTFVPETVLQVLKPYCSHIPWLALSSHFQDGRPILTVLLKTITFLMQFFLNDYIFFPSIYLFQKLSTHTLVSISSQYGRQIPVVIVQIIKFIMHSCFCDYIYVMFQYICSRSFLTDS